MPSALPSGPGSGPSSGTGFVLSIFVIGAAVTLVVGYLGVAGVLSGGIEGTQSGGVGSPPALTSCQGHGALGSFHFSLIANEKGARSFNGSSPGPCFAVAWGSTVAMNFSVAAGSNHTDSWALIGPSGPVTQPPVFAGAGWTNASATTGLRPGENFTFHFTASTPGKYRYVSQIDGSAAAGLWGPFNVTAQALTTTHGSGASPTTTSAAGPVSGAAIRALLLTDRK